MRNALLKKSFIFGIVVLLIEVGVVPTICTNEIISDGNEDYIYVDWRNEVSDTNGTEENPYPYIWQAIENASSTKVQTIIVRNGTYNESIIIDKPLKLIGDTNNATTIDGYNRNSIINIVANGVTINNFNLTFSKTDDKAGIKIFDNDDLVVKNCNISNCFFAIQLRYANDCMLINNNISNNGVAFLLSFADRNVIKNNIISYNAMGIVIIQTSNFNRVIENNITMSNFSLFISSISLFNVVWGNNIKNNPEGVVTIGLYNILSFTFAEFNYWGAKGPFPPRHRGELILWLHYWLPLPFPLFSFLVFPWLRNENKWWLN